MVTIVESIMESIRLYAVAIDEIVFGALETLKFMAGIFLIVVLALVFTIVYKIFVGINNELQHAQVILLMLPVQAIHNIPELKALVSS